MRFVFPFLRMALLSLFVVGLVGCASEDGDGDEACAAGQERCEGVCVDTASNAAHCGGCGLPCGEGEICGAGMCIQACGEEEVLCADGCVDPLNSTAHCGACEKNCAEGEVCSFGECLPPCDGERVRCDGSCVDLASDSEHCGGCGTACGDGRSCQGGSCVCSEGREDCNGFCLDTSADPENCGGCGNICKSDEVCSAGACKVECDFDWVACGASCVDTGTSLEHCGACDHPCGESMACEQGTCLCLPGFERCDGLCVDTDSDGENCGFCGTVCPEGRTCSDGQCQCPEGMIECDGQCIDPATDAAHCGGCDKVCALDAHATSASTCEARACSYACEEGWGDCGPAAGCETEITSDILNCGGCGITCRPGELCSEGICLCPEGALVCGVACIDVSEDLVNCGACSRACRVDQICGDGSCFCPEGKDECADACVDTDTNAQHCGGCGKPCRDDQLCSGGSCACPSGREECNGACVDTSRDVENCGGCEKACGPDRTCSNSSCVCTGTSRDCDGVCKDVSKDVAHCGACGNACRGDQVCNWQCVCPAGMMECSGECVEIGACGDPCPGCAFGCDERGGCAGVLEVAGGKDHTCVVNSFHEVWCWGDNTYGQLGNATLGPVTSARAVRIEGFEERAMQIAAGDHHSCLVSDGGKVYCWGRGDYGQVGSGQEDREVPTYVEGVEGGVVQVAAGRRHTCALTEEMLVMCWGHGGEGQLGDGQLHAWSEPVYVNRDGQKGSPLEGVMAIAASNSNSCALVKDGVVWCWGAGTEGQNGDGQGKDTGEDPLVQVEIDLDGKGVIPLEGVMSIAGGAGPSGNRNCAVFGDYQAACWGNNDSSALGDGSQVSHSTVAVGLPLKGAVLQIVTADTHGCVLMDDMTVHCWGDQSDGKIGNRRDRGTALSAEQVMGEGCKEPLEGVMKIGRGHEHTCAITKDERLFCWGKNDKKQAGDHPDVAILCAAELVSSGR